MTRVIDNGSTISVRLAMDDWKLELKEEVIINIANDLVKFSQVETKLDAACGHNMRKITCKNLTNDTIMIVHINSWSKVRRAPRKEIDTSALTNHRRYFREKVTLDG